MIHAMKIETQYTYEKSWALTNEADLLRIITEEVGDADPKGILEYIKDAIKGSKTITVGTCRFRRKQEG
jgi:hypothetical protein